MRARARVQAQAWATQEIILARKLPEYNMQYMPYVHGQRPLQINQIETINAIHKSKFNT